MHSMLRLFDRPPQLEFAVVLSSFDKPRRGFYRAASSILFVRKTGGLDHEEWLEVNMREVGGTDAPAEATVRPD
ncbi:hypothetical protein FQN53_001377 [Emmonsiellopsis sp. PD_33]|nr:hypothetical protein FQN53_001377 [Emmonsiellopsis sp. PD_33]